MNGLIKKVVYAYSGILLGNKKELSTNTHCNTDEPYRRYGTWEKPIQKKHILFDSIYI